ncbi:MAG TPA: pyruvoyl-dependent arginine decarboxylase [Propionibacteriaceae bacterium]|nr:pyruvoyl-dependent arginine decarboxylase [Propionibacteriaceae bacterium]
MNRRHPYERLSTHRTDTPLTISDTSWHHAPAPLTPRSAQTKRELTIRVSTGVGEGATRLAAFDAALRSAGVGDFNLIRLSSVIPPQAAVAEVDPVEQLTGGHGDLLYCVYADAYASTPGERAWAGLAWSRRAEQPGGGLFVEHTGHSRTAVERDLQLSLDDLSRGRGGGFTAAGRALAYAECGARPVCALVVASYRNSDWSHHGG